jgi:serine protease inhibitor
MRRWSVLLPGLLVLAAGLRAGGASPLRAADEGPAPANQAVAASNAFAFDLYNRLAEEKADRPLFFSPWSISNALTIAAEGARKETLDEMGKALRFPEKARQGGNVDLPWSLDRIHSGAAAMNQPINRANELANLGARDRSKSLRIATALWAERTYPFRSAYLRTIREHYGSAAFPVDFIGDPKAARGRINAWVEKQTRSEIKDLLPPDSIDHLTRLVISNAIFFKGVWMEPFAEARTANRPFTLRDGKVVQVPTMNATLRADPSAALDRPDGKGTLVRATSASGGRVPKPGACYAAFNKDGSLFDTPLDVKRGGEGAGGYYPDAAGFELLELPYKDGLLSMVVIVPRSADGLPALEKRLGAESLRTWLGKARQRDVHVFLPRFTLRASFDLQKPLEALGMKRAFTGQAQFHGLVDSKGSDPGLCITGVFHKAFVEVNEEGTTAAAASGVVVGKRGVGPTPFTPTFKAERPFVLLIQDRQTGAILFLGRILNPASGS